MFCSFCAFVASRQARVRTPAQASSTHSPSASAPPLDALDLGDLPGEPVTRGEGGAAKDFKEDPKPKVSKGNENEGGPNKKDEWRQERVSKNDESLGGYLPGTAPREGEAAGLFPAILFFTGDDFLPGEPGRTVGSNDRFGIPASRGAALVVEGELAARADMF